MMKAGTYPQACRYRVITVRDGTYAVTIYCGIEDAKVLLKEWAATEPNFTSCRDMNTGQTIICFTEQKEVV